MVCGAPSRNGAAEPVPVQPASGQLWDKQPYAVGASLLEELAHVGYLPSQGDAGTMWSVVWVAAPAVRSECARSGLEARDAEGMDTSVPVPA